jgi:hypothetical protein
MEITFFPCKSKGGNPMFIAKHEDGKSIICTDADLKPGHTVILDLSDDGKVYFAKCKENGIKCKVATS